MIDGNLKTESALERELDDLLCHSLTVNSGPEKEALLEQMKEVFDQ
jgi:hypothetical protein